MAVEPFDLDVDPGGYEVDAGRARSQGRARKPAPTETEAPRSARRRWPMWAVLTLAVVSALVAATVTDLHVSSRVSETTRARELSQAHLVITDGSYLAGRVQAEQTPTGQVTVAQVLFSVQVVNAGPRTVSLVRVHGDGDAARLRDVLGDGQPLAAATSTRVAVIGDVQCPERGAIRLHSITVTARSGDGRAHVVRAGPEAVSAWANGMERACSQWITTP